MNFEMHVRLSFDSSRPKITDDDMNAIRVLVALIGVIPAIQSFASYFLTQ